MAHTQLRTGIFRRATEISLLILKRLLVNERECITRSSDRSLRVRRPIEGN